MTDLDYYRTHWAEYHEKTIRIDPAGICCGSNSRDLKLPDSTLRRGLAELARRHAGCLVIEGDFETFDFQPLSVNAISG
jgi:hypothetical protein